ncbi:MAG: hypothetical protein CSYNP_01628 [Syntrophus sp. SKADARSKE-3]|nr:hypothetical protein [Syntrophus sp. SKADARSKE-3]
MMASQYPANKERADRARATIEFYKTTCMGEGDNMVCQSDIDDLFTDIRHMIDDDPFLCPNRSAFEDAVYMSEQHFIAEQNGED